MLDDIKLLSLTVATVRMKCTCVDCDRFIADTLKSFEIRANAGDRFALQAALKIITAHYPATLASFYERSKSWSN
jgi:hypothetical protein